MILIDDNEKVSVPFRGYVVVILYGNERITDISPFPSPFGVM